MSRRIAMAAGVSNSGASSCGASSYSRSSARASQSKRGSDNKAANQHYPRERSHIDLHERESSCGNEDIPHRFLN